MGILKIVVCLMALCGMCWTYEVVGESVRYPKVGDCMDKVSDCDSCIRTGCFFYILTPMLHPAMCFPSYMVPPMRELIQTVIQNVNNCTFNGKNWNMKREVYVDTPLHTTGPSLPTPTTPENKTVYGLVIGILVVLLVAAMLLVVVLKCRQNRRRPINNEGIQLNNLTRNNPII